MNIHIKITYAILLFCLLIFKIQKNKETNPMTLDIIHCIFKSSFNFIVEKADKTQVPVKIYEIVKSIRRVKRAWVFGIHYLKK